MNDPGFYPLLQAGDGSVFLIHCEGDEGRMEVGVMIVEPSVGQEWAQCTSEADYEGDRCSVMLPSACVNATERLKIYGVNLPYKKLA
jgi:hypothetical protein